MPFNAPSPAVFWAAVLLVVVAIVAAFVPVPLVSPNAQWIAVTAFVILAGGCMMNRV